MFIQTVQPHGGIKSIKLSVQPVIMFTLILKNDKLRSYTGVALSILLLHLFFFIYFLLRTGAGTAAITGIGVSALSVLRIYRAGKNKRPLFPTAVSFSALAIVWFMMPNYWLAAAMLALAFLDIVSMKKLSIMFYEDRIEFPSFPRKTFRWDELSNVILKDRILTLDFKNDHLLQQEIAEESYGVDENRFNLFCSSRLPAGQT